MVSCPPHDLSSGWSNGRAYHDRFLIVCDRGVRMFEWSEEHQMIRKAVRDFVDKEVRPLRDELEHGDLAQYDILRKL